MSTKKVVLREPTLASPHYDGPWQVVLYGGPDNDNWYIFNEETRKYRKVGRVQRGKGVNYYDRAHLLARGLNYRAEGR